MTESLGHVLLVDDDLAIVRLLRKWLEGAGYRVSEASNGSDALRLIEKECPQYLISDWEMPYMDGLELCRLVRSREAANYLFTILLTGRAFPNDIIAGLDAGADEFIKKPVDRAELLARLRSGSRVIALEKRLHQMANVDGLTGLPNRKSFMAHLEREWNRSVQYKIPLSMVMLDIDFFKRVNDQHGHLMGDEVLRQMAAALKSESRDVDFLGRYGGEEFCLFLPETTEAGAQVVAERIRVSLQNKVIKTAEGIAIPLTASIGVAQRMEDTNSPNQLIDMADQALLVAKRSGRNRTVEFRSLHQPRLPEQVRQADPTALLKGVTARTVMNSVVASLHQNETLATAAQFFLRFRLNSAPVVNETSKLVGMVSEKDIMATMLCEHWWQIKISEVMKTNVVWYDEQTPASTVYEFLCNVTLRGVVIVKEGEPVGIINRGSLIRFFINMLAAGKSDNQGIQQDLEADELLQLDNETPQLHVTRTVAAMIREAEGLQEILDEQYEELVPGVVGGASRMQELVNDLLAFSRYVNHAAMPTDSANTLPANSPLHFL